MISWYSPPDETLLRESWGTVWACHYQGLAATSVVRCKQIESVVAVIPMPDTKVFGDGRPPEGPLFVVEKMGLDVGCLGGIAELLTEE